MKQKTTEEFIIAAKIKHGNKYNYKNTIYTGNKNKIKIICQTHGEFEQQASSHLLGRNCEKCSYEIRAKNRINKTYYRKQNFNEHYFLKINTQYKAYFLGLLYADGCIYDKDKLIEIGLNKKDVEILQKYKNELKYNKPFKINNDNSIYVSICSIIMYNDLINLGLTSNKSLTIEFPKIENVSDKYINHFIRGYFDGDGCISQNKKLNCGGCISILGSLNFLTTLKEYFENKYKINSAIYKYNSSKIHKLCISKNSEIIKIKNIFYNKNTKIFLKRKKQKFIEYEKCCNIRKNRKNNTNI